MRLTNDAYSKLKSMVLITLPLVSSLCFLSSYIWDLPYTKIIMGIISLITLLLGSCLIVSSNRYSARDSGYDGQMHVIIPEDGPKVFSLELNGDPEKLAAQDSITFKILPEFEKQ